MTNVHIVLCLQWQQNQLQWQWQCQYWGGQTRSGRICSVTTSCILYFSLIFQSCNYNRFSLGWFFFFLFRSVVVFVSSSFSLFFTNFPFHFLLMFAVVPFCSDLFFSVEILFLSALIMIYKGCGKVFSLISTPKIHFE